MSSGNLSSAMAKMNPLIWQFDLETGSYRDGQSFWGKTST